MPPLVVRIDSDGRIVVIEGHCRRRGALLAIERGAELLSVDTVPFKGSDIERVEITDLADYRDELANAQGMEEFFKQWSAHVAESIAVHGEEV